MRIAISLLNLRPGKLGGIETYVRRLVAHMSEQIGPDQIILVAHRDNAGAVPAPGVEQVVVNKDDRKILRARILETFTPYRARFAEKAFDEIQPDVAFFPLQSIFPKRVSVPIVLTVADVQHLFFPQYFSLFKRAFRATAYERSFARADRIIAISEYTKKTLAKRCGVDPAKVVAIPFGLTRETVDNVVPYDKVPGPYLYYPAATFRHKGHRTLFDTFAKLRARGDFPYKLVLTGHRTDYWPELARQIETLGLGDSVIHLGFLPFEDIPRVYASAEAIVFPTEFEGFGLPVIEAVQFRKKVIMSRLEVFDEIRVPRRFQIDFSDPDQLLRALQEPGPTVLEEAPSTWSDVARETLQVLRQAAGQNTPRSRGQQDGCTDE